jgi:hypothetical protein
MVSRTAGMRPPTASTSTILPILPRRRRSVKVMATTPAGLSGAAPAAVNTHLWTGTGTRSGCGRVGIPGCQIGYADGVSDVVSDEVSDVVAADGRANTTRQT